MRKKLLMAIALLVSGVGNLWADPTDVTSTYLTNTDFSGSYSAVTATPTATNKDRSIFQPSGWDIEMTSKNQYNMSVVKPGDPLQDSYFTGTYVPTDGKYMVRFREDKTDEYIDLSQTITITEAGLYLLSADLISEDRTKLKVELYAGSQKVANFSNGTWQNRSILLNVSENQTIKIGVKYSNNNGNQKRGGADNFKLEKLGDLPVDVTELVANPTFDNNIDGWTTYLNPTNNQRQNSRTSETEYFWENWKPANSGRMFQTITSLPSGTYKLRIMAFAQDKGTMTPANTDVAVYAKGNGDNVRRNYVNSTDFTYYDTYAYVDAGSLEIGLRADVNTFEWLGMDNVTLQYVSSSDQEASLLLTELQTKWTAVKSACNILEVGDYSNVTGNERTNLSNALKLSVSAIADYATNAATLQTAYLAFIDAKTNYDKYAEETERAIAMGVDAGDIPALTSSGNYLTTLHELIVLEDAAVTTGYPKDATGIVDEWNVASGVKNTWTPQNAGTGDDNHWSGTTQTYYNTYDSKGFTMSLSKTVSLPAGSYVLKAAARCYKVNGNDDFYLGVTPSGSTLKKEIYTSTGGGAGLGIDKTGAANYTEADDTYAYDNKGYGWEWRFVHFVITGEGTTDVELKITANILAEGWVSFSDVQLLTTSDNTTVFQQIYNTAKSSAESARDNATYKNVKGVERQGLLDAIGASVTASIDWYSSQKTALDAAITTFVGAKNNYNSLATAISDANTIVTNSINVGDGAFKVPTSVKTTLSNAKNTASETWNAAETTSSVASSAAETLNTAITTYGTEFAAAELNAPLESTPYNLYLADGGVSYANNLTFKDGNASAGTYAMTFAESNNSFNQAVHFKAIAEQKNKYYLYIIDAEGNKHYICTGTIYGGNNDQIRVTDTEANALAVLLVASSTENGAYNLKNTASSDKLIGTSDGGFYTTTKYNKFNINAAAQCEVPIAITSGKWGTRIFPFEVTSIPDGLKAYTITGTSGDAIVKSDALAIISANTPVLLKASKDVDTSVSGYGVAKTNSYTEGLLTGVYTAETIAASDGSNTRYVLQTQEDVQAFYKVTSAFTASPNRCYLTVPVASGVKAFYLDGDETAVRSVKADELQGATIYNLAGQRVSKAQKGVYIINGKKVAVK